MSESIKECNAHKTLLKGIQHVIKALPDDVPFNVVIFGQQTESLWPKSQLKNKKTASAAAKFLEKFKNFQSDTDVLLGLQEVCKLPKFDGFDRQCILFTDGHANLGLSELEMFIEMAKAKGMKREKVIIISLIFRFFFLLPPCRIAYILCRIRFVVSQTLL